MSQFLVEPSSVSLVRFVFIVANIKLLLIQRCKDLDFVYFLFHFFFREWGKLKRRKLSSMVDWISREKTLYPLIVCYF